MNDKQIILDSVLPVTEGLLCSECWHNTVTLTSSYSERYSCYYNHVAQCSLCGHTSYPTGVKDFLIKHWDSIIRNMNDYQARRRT